MPPEKFYGTVLPYEGAVNICPGTKLDWAMVDPLSCCGMAGPPMLAN